MYAYTPNATLPPLTFRSMDGMVHQYLSDWKQFNTTTTTRTVREILVPSSAITSKRVRNAVPRERLVEIDLEDNDNRYHAGGDVPRRRGMLGPP